MELTLKKNKKITTEEIRKNMDQNGFVTIKVEELENLNYISGSYRRKTVSMPEWFKEWSTSFENRINTRFEKIEDRLTALEDRVEKIEGRLSTLEGFHKEEDK